MTDAPQPLTVFIGFDQRQTVSYTVAAQSLIATSRTPLAIRPLVLDTLKEHGFERRGLTPFTYSRFLVPWLMGFKGWAVFVDSDIIALRDVAELVDWCQGDAGRKIAQAAKQTEGGKLVEYPDDAPAVWVRDVKGFEFERAAIMVFNCGHPALRRLTPGFVNDPERLPAPHVIGPGWGDNPATCAGIVGGYAWASFPTEWGVLVGYEQVPPTVAMAHFTQGVPCHDETRFMPLGDTWQGMFRAAVSTQPWIALMGQSVHAYKLPDGKVVPLAHPLALAHQNPASPAPQEAAGEPEPSSGTTEPTEASQDDQRAAVSDPEAETRRLYGDDYADFHPHVTEPDK